MAHLDPDRLEALRTTLIESGLINKAWLDSVLAALPEAYRVTLPESDVPRQRLEQALQRLNGDGVLTDGTLPLAVVLHHLVITEVLQAIVSLATRLLEELGASAQDEAKLVAPEVALGEVRVVGKELFAARQTLRARLIELGREDGPPAVIVNGPTKVGKSHTFTLIRHAALATSAFRLASVRIEPEEIADFTADWLVESLVRSLVRGQPVAPARREPTTRWLSDLTAWTFDQLATVGTNLPIWMVIDGVRPTAKDEVRGMVTRLAARTANQTGALVVRMILIDFDATTIRSTGCNADEEQLAHLTAADAEAALRVLDPQHFDENWPKVQAALAQVPALTTPLVSAVMRASLMK